MYTERDLHWASKISLCSGWSDSAVDRMLAFHIVMGVPSWHHTQSSGLCHERFLSAGIGVRSENQSGVVQKQDKKIEKKKRIVIVVEL